MHLQSRVFIRCTSAQVWSYLGDIHNVPAWDRGVKSVRRTSAGPDGVGLEFDTLAYPRGVASEPEWGKMSYRVTAADPTGTCTVQLTSSSGNARFFKTAEWRWRVEEAPEGAWVICAANFKLRFPYVLLAPIFWGMKKAIRSDLEHLKQVLEEQRG
ncbi:MAG: SRPBCC family protein [Bryobacteraceae bacterium]